MNNVRSDSTLAQLAQAQRNQLYDWICDHGIAKTIELAAKPVEQGGFDLQFHRTTLDRFRDGERKDRHARELAALAASAEGPSVPEEIDRLISAAKAEFAHSVYELAKRSSDPKDFECLERALHHVEMAKLKREQLEFQKAAVHGATRF